MKKYSCSLLMVFYFMGSQAQQPPIQVVFILNSSTLPADSSVYITGGLEQLGNWNPGKVKMNYDGNHTWRKEISIPIPLSIEYKFTLGSWANEGANANGLPLPNLSSKIIGDTVISNNVLCWTNGKNEVKLNGQVTGAVKYHRALHGSGISDRDIIVWVPPGYESEQNKKYPVLYMHDGQNIFDPATSSFGVDWRIDEAIDSLIKSKSIDPMIVVGINNTKDRMKEYMPGQMGSAYMSFIVEKLKPFIDSTYRTMQDRNNTLVGGSSAGGICSFMMVWEYPDVFSKAICMSPAFKIMNWDYVKVVNASKKRKNVFFYIDNGGVDLESQLQPGITEMVDALKTKGYKQKIDFAYFIEANAKHSEAAWAKRFPNALLSCFPR